MATKTTTTKAAAKRPAKPAAKATAAKATAAKRSATTAAAKSPAKAAAKRAPAKASASEVDLTAVAAAAKLVTKLRAQLDAAVVDRNSKMVAAHGAGARVTDLVGATGFASAGAVQAALKSGAAAS